MGSICGKSLPILICASIRSIGSKNITRIFRFRQEGGIVGGQYY
jgi:hypothetical protein